VPLCRRRHRAAGLCEPAGFERAIRNEADPVRLALGEHVRPAVSARLNGSCTVATMKRVYGIGSDSILAVTAASADRRKQLGKEFDRLLVRERLLALVAAVLAWFLIGHTRPSSAQRGLPASVLGLSVWVAFLRRA